MFCTKCGKKLDPSARFCSGCGNPVAAPAAVEENVPEAPAPAAAEENAPETSVPETPAPAAAEEKAPETSVPEAPAPAAAEEKAPETSVPETPAPAAVEENAPETSVPEAPAPAAVEENAPETSVPETPAPAAVEENVPETSVPETPAPAAVEENAPETSVPESPAPAAVEEKAPETSVPETPAPATAEENAPETSAPEAPAPAAVEENVPETSVPEAPAPAAVEENVPETSASEAPAPAAVEENAPETSASEAPAPAAVEENAPETSVPETPAPAAVEVKTPEAEGGIPQSPLPAPSFAEFAAENPAPKKKKKKVGPIIGISAAAVVIGGSAVGYFCFHNQVMRLLMGDAGFALSVEKKTGEFFGVTDPAAADEAIAAYLDGINNTASSGSDENFALFSSLLPMADRLGGSEITYGMSIEADGLLSAILTQSEQTDALLGMLGNFKGILRVTDGENCDRFESVVEYGGERLFGADLYSDGETVAVSAPDLTDYVFFGKLPAEEQAEEAASLSPAEIGRIRAMITELYYEALSDGEITYTDGEFLVAGQTVSATRIETSLTAEQTNALYANIREALKNDETVRDYYLNSLKLDAEEYEKLFENDETAFSSFRAVSYIDGRASLLAKSYSFGMDETDETDGTDSGEKTATFTLLRAEDETHFRMETSDGARYTADTVEAAEGFDGTVEFSYCNVNNGENPPTLVLALDYTDLGVTYYLGETVRLGSYTLRISDKDTLIQSLFAGSASGNSGYDYFYDETVSDLSASSNRSDMSSAIMAEMLRKLSLTFTVSENTDSDGAAAIRSEWSLRMGEYLGLNAYLEMRPFEETETPVMPTLDGEKCLDMNEEQTEETSNQIRIDLYENLLRLTEKNQAFGKLAEQLGLKEQLESAIEEEREKSEFLRHYADYSEYKKYRVNRVAESLAREFDSEYWSDLMTLNEDGSGVSDASEEDAIRTVKLYFDREGEMTVLDNGGFGFLDFDEIEKNDERKSLYCEVIFSPYGKTLPNGVTVVYTDDPADLPDGLPTVYHYLDEVYEWNGKENAKDGFMIGTSPRLSEGVTTAEERIRLEREERERQEQEIAKLNDAAKKINNAVTGFLSANSGFFRTDVRLASIIVKYDVNRGWIVESFTGDDLEPASQSALFTGGVSAASQLADHLNRRFPDFEPVTAQIHFMRGYDANGAVTGGANAPASLDVMSAVGTAAITNGTGLFQDNGLPDVFDFWTGYCNWNEHNPTADPQVGVYWTVRGEYTLVGTYCKETKAPLAYWDQVFSYDEEDYFGGSTDPDDPLPAQVDELNRDARLLADTIVGLFGGTAIDEYDENDDSPLFSLILNRHGNVWQMNGVYINNYFFEYSDDLIDDDTRVKIMTYLNELAGSGDLPMSRDVKAELHFYHNEFVGAAVIPTDSSLDFTDYGVPESWDFYCGFFSGWNRYNTDSDPCPGIYWINSNTAAPLGSYCTLTGAPLLLTASE